MRSACFWVSRNAPVVVMEPSDHRYALDAADEQVDDVRRLCAATAPIDRLEQRERRLGLDGLQLFERDADRHATGQNETLGHELLSVGRCNETVAPLRTSRRSCPNSR